MTRMFSLRQSQQVHVLFCTLLMTAGSRFYPLKWFLLFNKSNVVETTAASQAFLLIHTQDGAIKSFLKRNNGRHKDVRKERLRCRTK